MRARASLANVERELRAAGAEVTIHAMWVALADRAGEGGEPNVRAAGKLRNSLTYSEKTSKRGR